MTWEGVLTLLVKIATILTGLSAILVPVLTYRWQKRDSKHDERIRKWAAEYPHKLKLFTDFYDVLFRFVNYTGSSRQRSSRNGGDWMDIQVRVRDLLNFELQINRIDEECKILFSKDVQEQVHKVYIHINKFINKPITPDNRSIKDLEGMLENSRLSEEYNQMTTSLRSIQEEIKNQKIAPNLRNLFIKELELSGGENEKN